jgi:sulfur-carrier protein adenylyltransferase/sulfurtransferase
MSDRGTVLQILDLARWAPSGDNKQVWRFEIVTDEHVAVHAFDTRDEVIYDLHGHASQLSVGALLETLRVAASGHGRSTSYTLRPGSPDTRPVIDVHLAPDPGITRDPLFPVITKRTTQRRPMRRRQLSREEKQGLEAAAGPRCHVRWLEGPPKRRAAWLLFRLAILRLSMPEVFSVSSQVIEWGARYSEDRIPAKAVGLDPLMTRMMPLAMRDWKRYRFMNRWMGGTLLPGIELDLIPALFCGAHFLLYRDEAPTSVQDHLEAGQALQRFWLTATRLGLQLQPAYGPICFARYHREGRTVSATPELDESLRPILGKFTSLYGEDAWHRAFFMGRIGAGHPPSSRSVRLPLERLMRE